MGNLEVLSGEEHATHLGRAAIAVYGNTMVRCKAGNRDHGASQSTAKREIFFKAEVVFSGGSEYF
jgi:hypothetical protein